MPTPRFSIRVKPAVLTAWKRAAKAEGLSLTALIHQRMRPDPTTVEGQAAILGSLDPKLAAAVKKMDTATRTNPPLTTEPLDKEALAAALDQPERKAKPVATRTVTPRFKS